MTFAGRLRHRVTLQEPVSTKDAYGQEVIAWQDVATVWASIEPLRGKEYLEAQQHTSETLARIVLRAQGAPVRSTWRLLYGQETWEIQSVIDPRKRGDYLELMARKIE